MCLIAAMEIMLKLIPLQLLVVTTAKGNIGGFDEECQANQGYENVQTASESTSLCIFRRSDGDVSNIPIPHYVLHQKL